MEVKPFFCATQINNLSRLPPPVKPAATPSNIKFFTAPQLRTAYNYQPVTNNSGIRKVKIAIIIAYTYKNLLADLKAYWTSAYNFGSAAVPPSVFIKTMPGATFRSDWAIEECLDVQMVCAMNPNAEIYVVEAKSASFMDIVAAINYASNTICADILSMSWGCNDSLGNGQSSLYQYFSNPRICYCAASGDSNTPSFPSTHANVLSVGGTSLTSISPRTEITWMLGGSGFSSQVLKPSYQNTVSNITKNFRAIPDVSAIANPTNGVMVCYNNAFYTVGGTSASTPIFSAILSIAIQKRLNSKKTRLLTTVDNPPVATSVNLQSYLYKTLYNNNYKNTLYNSCFNDILTGKDGVFEATTGYDFATGLGSPNCTNLCNNLLLL